MHRPDVIERYATFAELRPQCVSSDDEWLSIGEQRELDHLSHPTRRETWRLGRLLSKQIILEAYSISTADFASIDIMSRNDTRQAVRPVVSIDGEVMPCCLSISHTDAAALAVLTTSENHSIGCDLVRVEEVSQGFLDTWFTARERSGLHSATAGDVARAWAAKEAAYKAYNNGEAFTPRRIEIIRLPNGNLTCSYRGQDLSGHCEIRNRMIDGFVALVVIADSSIAGDRTTDSESTVNNAEESSIHSAVST